MKTIRNEYINLNGTDCMGNVGVNRRCTLKLSFEEQVVEMWTGLNWRRV
jgi:hypothetical protein